MTRAPRASLSVIIPVRNEERFIEWTLRYLLDQDRTGLDVEFLVVDGQSDDRTCEIVQRLACQHPEVQLHHNPRRLSSAARNIGIRASTGEYVLIVDGHCEIPDRQHLQKVVAAFETSGADCLGRPQPLDVTNATTLQRAIAAARASRLGHHPESFIYASEPCFAPAKSVAVAYRRSVFAQVGYFDERFDAHEDGEFNFRIDRAGLKCYFTPAIAIKYVPRSSLRGLFRQMVRYGRGRVRFSRKHPGTGGMGVLVPAAFVAYFLAGGVPAIAVAGFRLPILVSLGVYAGVVMAFSTALAVKLRKLTILAWLLLVFLTIHIGAGVGIWLETIKDLRDSLAARWVSGAAPRCLDRS